MSYALKLFVLCCGIGFSCGVLYLLLKRKINERHSIIWLGGVLAILLLSAYPEWIDMLAYRLGIDYPPSLLFLISILLLAMVVLYQSVQISALNEKLRDLTQHVALQYMADREPEREKFDGK